MHNQTGRLGRRVPIRSVADKRAKLNPGSVKLIRKRFATGESTRTLAREFDVRDATILDVVYGLTWKAVGGPRAKRSSRPYRKLTVFDVRAIRKAYRTQRPPVSMPKLARRYKVAYVTISKIIHRRTWKDA